MADPGGWSGGSGPLPPPHQTWYLLETKILTTIGWLNFLMKRVLYFTTKLNSRDIQLGTLLWSVRLCSQSSISRANGDWLSQIEKHVVVSAFSVTSGRGCGGKVICHKKVQQSFLNQNLDLPPPQWKIPGSPPAKMLLWVRSQSRLMLARASKSIFFELRGSLVGRKTV